MSFVEALGELFHVGTEELHKDFQIGPAKDFPSWMIIIIMIYIYIHTHTYIHIYIYIYRAMLGRSGLYNKYIIVYVYT